MTTHEAPWGETREWYTPPDLFVALGVRFDLDVASPMSGPVPWVPADRFLSPRENGLMSEWTGCVWCNPPYGPPAVAFVDRMIAHGNGLLLLPSRTETRAYQRALVAADATCLLRDRLWFTRADGFRGRSSFGSTLFAFGDRVATVLRRADLGVCVRSRPPLRRIRLPVRRADIAAIPDWMQRKPLRATADKP